jgi:hypothetical protein
MKERSIRYEAMKNLGKGMGTVMEDDASLTSGHYSTLQGETYPFWY